MTDQAGRKGAAHHRTVLATLIAALGLVCRPSQAAAAAVPTSVELSVVDRETGAPLPFWRRDGRPFVAGDPGHRYGLRVVNHTSGRVLLVLSVDGINVFSGETAGYDQRGYVLDAYERYDVDGWRKSTSEIAAFTFAALSGSYAARTGRPGDVGVIGMAVFRERVAPPPMLQDVAPQAPVRGRRAARRPQADVPPPPPLPLPPTPKPVPQSEAPPSPVLAPPTEAASGAARTSARAPDEKLGTAHGAREWSPITMVAFERATPFPQLVRRIEYDTAAHLLARGVTPPYPVGRPPRPFPLQPGGGFVPDPPSGR